MFINKNIFSAVLAILLTFCITMHGGSAEKSSYEKLDAQLVKAYNASPKQTDLIYVTAMRMLEKSTNDGDKQAMSWELKARKLITVSCFYECSNAVGEKKYRDAYIWAKRGLNDGERGGKIGSLALRSLYDYLRDSCNALERREEIQQCAYGKLNSEINNYRKTKLERSFLLADSDVKMIRQHVALFDVVEGPDKGKDGLLFVKVKGRNGRSAVIKNYPKKGWKAVAVSGKFAGRYYPSWQKSAEAIYNQEKL